MASQVSKLAYVDKKLGATFPGQQTTRVLFNTVLNAVAQKQITFFKTFQGLTNGQTNLTQNKLDSSESMVIKSLWFCGYSDTGSVVPIAGSNSAPEAGSVTCSVYVGNQCVVKNLPLQFNTNNGQAFDRLHANAGVGAWSQQGGPNDDPFIQYYVPTEVRLLTDIVLPPQVTFTVVLETEGLVTPFANTVVCALSGYGKIFSAGASF